MNPADAAVELLSIRKVLLSQAHRMGAGQDAEDCVQETYTRIWPHVKTIDAAGLRGYAFRTLDRVIVARWRRSQRRVSEISLDAMESVDALADIGEPDHYDESGPLSAIVAELPAHQRAVVECIARDPLSGSCYEDTAADLRINLNTMKTRLYRARARVVKKLREVEVCD